MPNNEGFGPGPDHPGASDPDHPGASGPAGPEGPGPDHPGASDPAGSAGPGPDHPGASGPDHPGASSPGSQGRSDPARATRRGPGGPRRGGSGRPVGVSVLRAPILVVIVAALIVGGLVDRMGAPADSAAVPVVEPVPVAAPPAALSSSWFCAGASGSKPSALLGRLYIANSGNAAVTGVVTIIPSNGHNRVAPLTVPAHSSALIPETVPGGAPWVGAIVDLDAGGVAVDQEVYGSLGVVATPCATSGSSHWYFANGFTYINTGVEISLVNPYPTDSVVDLSFTTDQGVEAPEDFQGLVVPGDGMLNVNLASHLRRRTAIATTVTARTGSVVAWKTDWASPPKPGQVRLGTPAASAPLADPAWPVPGVTLTLGSPSAGTTWTWPNGLTGGGLAEQYVIYNPGPSTADVKLSVGVAEGTSEPFNLSIGPYQVLPVVSQQQARIPAGAAHSAVLESTNGVPVVAERVIVGSGGSAGWSGFGELMGGRVVAPDWLVPLAVGGTTFSGSLVLYNPGSAPVTVRIHALQNGKVSALRGIGAFTIQPGQRRPVLLDVAGSVQEPLIVQANGPVYTESDFYQKGGQGISLSFGVPLTP
jgi:hypothetical protein